MPYPAPGIDRDSELIVVNAATGATAAPSVKSDAQFGSGKYAHIRVLTSYTAATVAKFAVWVWEGSAWYQLGDTDSPAALAPGTKPREARDFTVGRGALVYVQLQTLTGTNASASVVGADLSLERM